MKKLTALFIALFSLNLSAQKVDSVKTAMRIIVPASKEWLYYFYADEKGHPPILLNESENVFSVTTGNRKVNGYIYAKHIDMSRQTNNFSINLKGRPALLVVAGNNGVLVNARRFRTNKYLQYRNEIPEATRKPW